MQLIPREPAARRRSCPTKGQLADSQVEPSVTLDGVLSAFDPKTRRDFQVWMQSVAEGITGRGEQINASFADARAVRRTRQPAGQRPRLPGRGRAGAGAQHGVVFDALAGRDHQLEGLIVNGERTFHAAAEGSQAFADAFRALPTFERNSRVALKELDRFAADASPFLDQFRPAERQLAPLLAAAKPFAPEFNSFLTALGPLTKAAKKGLPDVKTTLDLTVPLLENFSPVLHNLDPFLQYLGQYVPELQAFFANFTAATQAHILNSNTVNQGPQQHYLRSMQVMSPESLAVYPQRIGTNRANPYFKPGAFSFLTSGGLQVFSNSSCSNPVPSVSGPANETISQSLIEQIIQFKVANAPESPNTIPAPGCNQQAPFNFHGQTSQFPHVTYQGK